MPRSERCFGLDGQGNLDTPGASRVWTLGALWTVPVLWTVGLLWTLVLFSTPRGVKNLDGLDLLGIENRVIPCAIGLQFVGWWAPK